MATTIEKEAKIQLYLGKYVTPEELKEKFSEDSIIPSKTTEEFFYKIEEEKPDGLVIDTTYLMELSPSILTTNNLCNVIRSFGRKKVHIFPRTKKLGNQMLSKREGLIIERFKKLL